MTVGLVSNGMVKKQRGLGAIQSALLQIARDYSGLPDIRTLRLSEILFYYDGLQAELVQRTAVKN